ncbi:MAG: TMEM175 family protein [Bacteroidota bacterium]
MIISTKRVESFSDGVIVIAITIMVLDLRLDVPSYVALTSKAERAALLGMAPQFLSYLLSFVMLGIMWVNHHHMYHIIRHVDGRLLWHNLHLLFWLTLVPFSTSIMGKNPLLPEATALYGFILFMGSLAFTLSRRYALRHNLMYVAREKALNDTLKRINQRARMKSYIGTFMYFIAIPLSFSLIYAAYVCLIIPAVLFFIPDVVDEKGITKVLFETFEKDAAKNEERNKA